MVRGYHLANMDADMFHATHSNVEVNSRILENVYTTHVDGMLQVIENDEIIPESAFLSPSSQTLDFGIVQPLDSLNLELMFYINLYVFFTSPRKLCRIMWKLYLKVTSRPDPCEI